MAGVLGLLSGQSLLSKVSERTAQVVLVQLASYGSTPDQPLPPGYALQYFPETLTDTKAINYATKEIPGGSLPLYQWISSGERIISFTAYFTSDNDLGQGNLSQQDLVSKGLTRRNVDIRSAMLLLRGFMLPTYGADSTTGTPFSYAPRKLMLWIPGSGIGLNGGWSTGDPMVSQTGDRVICVMTQCDITYEAFFPSGLPRIASVQLSFAQVGQMAGYVNFPQQNMTLDNVVDNGDNNLKVLPYMLLPNVKFA